MASRTVTKDIITLRGSAAIVSEFFGMLLCLIDLLDKNTLFKFSVRFSLLSFVENLGWSLYFFAIPLSGYAANR